MIGFILRTRDPMAADFGFLPRAGRRLGFNNISFIVYQRMRHFSWRKVQKTRRGKIHSFAVQKAELKKIASRKRNFPPLLKYNMRWDAK